MKSHKTESNQIKVPAPIETINLKLIYIKKPA